MKHTNVMLGIDRAQRTKDLRDADQRTRDKYINELSAEARVLSELQRSDAWGYFVKECQEEEMKVMGLLEASSDPTTLAKLTGTLLAVKSFQTFAQDRSLELQGILADLLAEPQE